MNQRSLTEGDVRSVLIRFTLPFLAASLLQFFYGAADLIIVGRFSDPAAMTAVSTGSQVMQTVTGLVTGLTTGGTVLVGQFMGARRERDVSQTIGTVFTLFTLVAVGLTVIFTLSTNLLVKLMQVPAAAVAPARQYLFICSCGIVFITGYNMVSGILRGLGDSRRPMIFVAIACVANVFGDLLLVGALDMGAAGAAIATSAAQGVSLVLSLLVLRGRDFPFDFKRASFRMRRDKVAKTLRLGAPVALQEVLVSLSFLIITAIVNHMGVVAQSAAVGVAERVIMFAMMAPVAFLSAISAMTAQNMGAGKPERASTALKYGMLFCLAFDVVMFLLLQLLTPQAVGLFTPDSEVVRHGVLYLRTYSIDCILVTFIFCLNGFFSGCGRTGFTLFNCLAATFAARVPLVLVLSLIPGVTLLHIGIAAPAASVLQIVIQLIYLRSGRWRSQNLLQTAG